MSQPNDYLGVIVTKPGDAKHYGVPGMKWGVRRSRKERAAAAAKNDAPKKTDGSKSSTSVTPKKGNIQDNVESSSARYARLQAEAKAGRASDMTEQDLKFFNARTEALAKINKLNEENPSWLRETTTKVVQQTAQRQMQSLSDTLADKYIGDPIKAAIKGAEKKN